nr:nucleotide exchange factor GrpE [uncultured Stomatobaculum sp.]
MAKDKHRHEREREERQSAEERAAMGAAAAAAEFEAEDKAKETAETAATASGQEAAEDGQRSAAQAEIEALNDRLKRTLAEFENFRKRSEREKAQMFDLGAKSVLEKFLPVIDNFERSVAQVPESEDSSIKAYAEGMDMIYRQLLKNLKEAGVEAIDAKGKPFDPAYHNAVMHEDNEALGENVVSEELQKGYLYKDSVLRHSMVKVAN